MNLVGNAFSGANRRFAVQWAVLVILGTAVASLAIWQAGRLGLKTAHQALRAQAASSVALNAAVLRSELEKQRSLPFVLSQDPDLRNALAKPTNAGITALNIKLERLAAATHAAVIFLLDDKGNAVAASNWNRPASPVGSDYRFRSYFQHAIKQGGAEYFALGTLTRQPGLYITRRIGPPGAPLGVIVVKVRFDQVEADWRRSDSYVYVTDPQGIVIISSVADWHFMRNVPMNAREARAIRASRQFGKAPLDPLPVRVAQRSNSQGDLVRMAGRGLFLAEDAGIATTPWRLHVLVAAQSAMNSEARSARSTAMLALMPLLALGGILLYRRQRAERRAAEAIATRAELEHRVEIRTAELRAINSQLSAEMDERQKAEGRLQTTRDELVQANRLALLGQVTAGVAHEVNQPVAAIRSYADNAAVLLTRGQTEAVRQNLATIAGLTARIGDITQELRNFSRKGGDQTGPTSLVEVIDGALLLLAGKIRDQGIAVIVERPPASLCASGKLIRLEQVLVNLLQNALEALEGRSGAEVRIGTSCCGDGVQLTVADNGPGIPDSVAADLFTPFTTSKPRGLGLGLVICQDIVTELGGRLELTRTGADGTLFTIHLRRAL
ncbi:MAG: sensor histidine kinase [Alphaproteobacteria bacterium]|nr:sensor histidine kinase [Alphaproteobacteria bacterium]